MQIIVFQFFYQIYSLMAFLYTFITLFLFFSYHYTIEFHVGKSCNFHSEIFLTTNHISTPVRFSLKQILNYLQFFFLILFLIIKSWVCVRKLLYSSFFFLLVCFFFLSFFLGGGGGEVKPSISFSFSFLKNKMIIKFGESFGCVDKTHSKLKSSHFVEFFEWKSQVVSTQRCNEGG